MYELTHGSLNYDNDSLDSLIFNPIDQAGHFPFNFLPSNCYREGEVNLKISVKNSEPKFSILHINSRSLLANIDKLKSMLACQQALPSVIAVTETRLNDLTSDQVHIPGYNFHSNHRTNQSGGGTGLYYVLLNTKFALTVICLILILLAFPTLCDQAFNPPFLGGKIIELAKFCFMNKRFETNLSFFSKLVIVSHFL